MNSQKGITLVELLAALALVGMLVILIFSVMTQGMKASERNTTTQRLQQEANLIVEKLRNEHLMDSQQAGYTPFIELEIVGDILKIKGEEILSSGYEYEFLDAVTPSTVDPKKMIINRSRNQGFKMEIKSGDHIYIIETAFSKL
jgi:type II secretory pathway pseudopilin PulG